MMMIADCRSSSIRTATSLWARRATLLLVLLSFVSVQGWVVLDTSSSSGSKKSFHHAAVTSLTASSSSRGGDSDNNMDDERRMEIVRSLQESFYKPSYQSSSSSSRFDDDDDGDVDEEPRDDQVMGCSLDPSTGIITRLPLWRVSWTELPGRTNVLNVHEAMYTNMFESILHGPSPWYVGHLYLQGGSQNLAKKEDDNRDPASRLCTWKDHNNNDNSSSSSSAVLGTLLRVVDYRRLQDGRLLLLVQAMERFTVVKVHQELPYGIADVQLIPDVEEVEEDSDWMTTRTECDSGAGRALALAESFFRWHRYEFENTLLPLPLQSDLPAEAIIGSALAQVLPYAGYSSVCDVARLQNEPLEAAIPPSTIKSQDNDDDDDDDDSVEELPTLEYRLMQANILKQQPSSIDPSLLELSSHELEIRLWLALNDFLKQTKTPVSPILLGLLPPPPPEEEDDNDNDAQQWPANFVLERIANAIGAQTEWDHKFVRVSPAYPAIRRQKRLSFCAAALLERISPIDSSVNAFRQELLEIPSTKVRMAYILQKLEDRLLVGEFE